MKIARTARAPITIPAIAPAEIPAPPPPPAAAPPLPLLFVFEAPV